MTDPQSVPPAYSSTPATQPKGLSIASLILGIVSVLLILTSWPSTIVGIVGLVLGVVARGRQPYARGLWLTGIILSAIGIVVSIIYLILLIAVIGPAAQNLLKNQ